MGITIGGLGSLADAGSASSAADINSTLQAQVQSSQTAEVNALFGSLGLGNHTNSLA